MCEKFKLGFKKIIFYMHINKEKYTQKNLRINTKTIQLTGKQMQV